MRYMLPLFIIIFIYGCCTKKEDIVINDCPTLSTIKYNPVDIGELELEYEVLDEKN